MDGAGEEGIEEREGDEERTNIEREMQRSRERQGERQKDRDINMIFMLSLDMMLFSLLSIGIQNRASISVIHIKGLHQRFTIMIRQGSVSVVRITDSHHSDLLHH